MSVKGLRNSICLSLPHCRSAIETGFVERGVPDRKHGVPQANCVSHDTLVRFIVQIRLPSLRVDVCVGTEEGHEGTGLVPSDEHFRSGIAEEAANIGCNAISLSDLSVRRR
jgi:hypothetical protein